MKTSSLKSSVKKTEPKKSSKLTSWPKNAAERKKLYDKYRSGHENLSYQFLEMMVKGEDIFKGITKPVIKRAYMKADEIGSSKNEGLITRKEFPYFLKYLLYFTDLFKAFDKIDEDKNKKLTLDEFIKNRSVLEDKMTKARAEELFKTMDKDGGGSISFDEFCNWGLEQPTILNYNNQEYFIVDNTAQDDEDPEELPMKTQESEEIKEEDASPQNKFTGEIDNRDNEIMALKARVLQLEVENQELQGKLLEGKNNSDSQMQGVSLEEHEKVKAMNLEQEAKIQEASQRENSLKSEIEQKNSEFQKLKDEITQKSDELNGQAKLLEEANQREKLLKSEVEAKNNELTVHQNESHKKIEEAIQREDSLKAQLESQKNEFQAYKNEMQKKLDGMAGQETTMEEASKRENSLKSELEAKTNELIAFQNETKKKIEDLEKQEALKLEEANQREALLQKKLEEKSNEFNAYQNEMQKKIDELAKNVEEANQRENLLKAELEAKNNEVQLQQSERNEMKDKIEELLRIEAQLKEEIELKNKDKENFLNNEYEALKKMHDSCSVKENQLNSELQEKQKAFEKISEEKQAMEDLITKNNAEHENQLEELKKLLKDCEGRCSKGDDIIHELENSHSKYKEESLLREAQAKEESAEQVKRFEELISKGVLAQKELEAKNDELKKEIEKKSHEFEEKINQQMKIQVELEDKIRVLEAMTKEVNADDLKKQLAEFETSKIHEEHNRKQLESKKIELEKQIQEIQISFEQISHEKENLKKSHFEEISKMSSLHRQLEEKIQSMEQNNISRQIHEEKELKSKREDFENRKEEMKMAFEAKIKELENEINHGKNTTIEQEKQISQLRKENEAHLKNANEKNESMRREYEEKIRNLEAIIQNNLKGSENNEAIKVHYEKRLQELTQEINIYKVRSQEFEKNSIEIKKTLELKLSQEIQNREKSIQKEEEKLMRLKEENEKLKKSSLHLENELNDFKKKQKEDLMNARKGSGELETSKVTENKSKDEIYGLLGQNKLDSSTEVALIFQKEQDISALKRSLSRLKKIVFLSSLFGVGMLLLVLLKSNNNCEK